MATKVAIVTGAGSGIGRAIALRLGEEGMQVAIFDLNGQAAESTAQAIRDAGGRAHAEVCDICDFEAVKRVVVPGNVKSRLLLHPLEEKAGGDFFHNGGKHFSSQNDPEWQVLKAFVMGQAN